MSDAVNSPLRKKPRAAGSPASSNAHEGLLDFEEDMINVTRRTPKSPRPPLLARDANTNSGTVSKTKNPLGIRETKRLLDEKNALIFQLRLQIDELKRQLERVPRSTREATESYEKIQRELEAANEIIHQQKYTVEDLKADLIDAQQAEEDARHLESVVLDLEQKLDETEREIQKRDQEMDQLHNEIEVLKESNLKAASKLSAASRPSSSDAKLRVQLVEALRNAAKFQTDIARLKNERQELFNQVTEERDKASALTGKLREENEELKQEIEKHKLDLVNLEHQVELGRSETARLQEAHARAQQTEQARYQQLESDYKTKTTELEKTREDMLNTVAHLQSQVADLNSQILTERQKTQAAVNERESTLRELKPDLVRSRARVSELELQVEVLKDQSQGQLDQLQQQAEERAQSRASQYDAQLETLQAEIEAKKAESATLASTIKRLEHSARERYLAHQEETRQLKDQVGDQFEKLNVTEAELKKARSEVETLSRTLKAVQDRQRELEQETSDLQVANRRAVNDAKAFEADMLRLQIKLESIEGRPLSASERTAFEETRVAFESLKAETSRQKDEWNRIYTTLQEESKSAQAKITELQRQVESYASQDQVRLQEQSWRIEANLKEAWQREQDRLNGEIATISNELAATRRLHGEAVRQLDEAQRQVVQRQTAITEYELAQVRLREQFTELEQTLVVRDNEVRSLREQMAHYTAKISSLQTLGTEATQRAQKAEMRSEELEMARQIAQKRLEDTVSETSARLESLQLDTSQKVASAAKTGAASAEAQYARQVEELKHDFQRQLSKQKAKLREIAEHNETQLIKEVVKVKRALDCTLKFSTELEDSHEQTTRDLVFLKEFASYADAKASLYDPPRPRRTFAGVAAFVQALVRMRRLDRQRVSPETERMYRDMLRKHTM